MVKKYYLILSILFAFILVNSSCDKDPATPAIIEAEVLATYLESAESPLGKDFVNTDMPTIIGASDLKTLNLTNKVYIVDIRSAADFTAGHIANAHNIALADIFTHLQGVSNLTTFEKIVVVCYTGQTSGFATSLLRLMGYSNAFSLKWGMSSWNTFFAAKWNSNIGNTYATQFTATASAKANKAKMPVLSTGKTTGEDILVSRVGALLTEGFGEASITSATVFGNLNNYYILNYWPADQYSDPGHIPGAIQYTPKESIKLAVDLTTLPTDKTIAVCKINIIWH